MRQVNYFPIQGGEDLLSPAISISPGRLLYSKNYECDSQGRPRRIDGFERYDGHPAPSDASYWVLNFDAGTAAIVTGNTVTGGTSGATGVALYDAAISTGAYATSDAAGYLRLTNVSGTFQNNESLKVGGVTKSVANGVATNLGADNDTDNATWLQAAIEAARANIAAVPGTGRIRGVKIYNGTRYAFRNDAAGTACAMYKSSATGWTLVDLGKKLAFTSGGVTEIVEGNVITGATSTKSATVKRVCVTSGTWAGGDAAGYFVISGQTGAFQAENLDVGAVLNLATIAGDSATITLLPSGRYEFEEYNFFGQAATTRLYGCDGVNPAFEFDGTVFCPIATRVTTDTPTHIKAHSKHLFLAFPGGTIKHSGLGYPLKWDSTSGSAEIAIGDTCVGMEPQPGGVLALWGRNSTHLLYGSDATDWVIKNHSRDSGAIEWTIQQMTAAMYLDDRGITSLNTVQQFGDFAGKTISAPISPVLSAKMSLAISSLRVRSKDQYRLFFSDNTGIIFTFYGKKYIGITRVDYGMPVRCCCTGEISGVEALMFGSDDGYVYSLDKGTSFDGSQIEAMIRLPFNHLKTPENNKRFFKAVFEIDAPQSCSLTWAEDYNYGDIGGAAITISVLSTGGYWDVNDWNSFLWSSPVVGSAEAYLHGSGKNCGIFIRSAAIYEQPHTLQGVLLHYSVRGLVK